MNARQRRPHRRRLENPPGLVAVPGDNCRECALDSTWACWRVGSCGKHSRKDGREVIFVRKK